MTIKYNANELGKNFEVTTVYIFKANTVEKLKSKTNKWVVISYTLGGEGSKTGLEFCWYNPKTFKALSQVQMIELKEWHEIKIDKRISKHRNLNLQRRRMTTRKKENMGEIEVKIIMANNLPRSRNN